MKATTLFECHTSSAWMSGQESAGYSRLSKAGLHSAPFQAGKRFIVFCSALNAARRLGNLGLSQDLYDQFNGLDEHPDMTAMVRRMSDRNAKLAKQITDELPGLLTAEGIQVTRSLE